MGPVGCGRVLVFAKHCCPQHCCAKRTKSSLWSWYRLVFAKLANLHRRSKCCCVACAFFSAVPVGSFSSPWLCFVGGAASGGIPLPWMWLYLWQYLCLGFGGLGGNDGRQSWLKDDVLVSLSTPVCWPTNVRWQGGTLTQTINCNKPHNLSIRGTGLKQDQILITKIVPCPIIHHLNNQAQYKHSF